MHLQSTSVSYTICIKLHLLKLSIGIQALAFTLPSMILFLHPSIRSLDSLHQQTLTHILSFASSYPANFKEVTSKLEQDMRECLEISVKEVLGGSSLTVADLVKPQISLRVFQHI